MKKADYIEALEGAEIKHDPKSKTPELKALYDQAVEDGDIEAKDDSDLVEVTVIHGGGIREGGERFEKGATLSLSPERAKSLGRLVEPVN